MKWITNAFPRLHINGIAQFVDGVFRSDDPYVIAAMVAWEGRYGVVRTNDDPVLPAKDIWPGAVLDAELDAQAGALVAGVDLTALKTAIRNRIASDLALPTSTVGAAGRAASRTATRAFAAPALPSDLASGEYVWFKTDGAGTLLDILSGVAS